MAEKLAIVIKKKSLENQELNQIKELIKSVKFGDVTIYIENQRIVQADINEKIRFGRNK